MRQQHEDGSCFFIKIQEFESMKRKERIARKLFKPYNRNNALRKEGRK